MIGDAMNIWDVWMLLAKSKGMFKVTYCGRQNARLKIAHELANQGRRSGRAIAGIDISSLRLELSQTLNDEL